MSWVLTLGAGKDQLALIKAIHAEDHKIVGVDSRPDAEGVDLCDVFRPISNRDTELILDFARWCDVQAVMVAGSEVADVGAVLALKLGLTGIPVATAFACKDKLIQKQILMAAGVPCTVPHTIYEGAAKATFDELKWHVVVKPRRGSGSKGVSYVDNPMELPLAIRAAEAIWPDVLAERYEPGPQLSVESLVWDESYMPDMLRSGFATPCVVDRWYPSGRPNFKEVGGSWPSEHDTPEIHDLMRMVARALGIHSGTLKADVVVTPEGPKIIECTPRLSGGPLASFARDGAGIDYLRAAVRIALGESPRLEMKTREKRIARLMDGTDVPWEEREKYLGQWAHTTHSTSTATKS